jgi:NAD-dependent SIR2 family protein deacetylase
MLKQWGESKPLGYFIFTSNIDGQFQKAGFPEDRILECHGSIHHLQCAKPCGRLIWSAGSLAIDINMETIQATSPLPRCVKCDSVARPNVLMFGDSGWIEDRSDEQYALYLSWLRERKGKRIVAIELGAGTAIPTVRVECERHASTLIRINPREPETPSNGIPIASGGLAALRAIDECLSR